MCAASRGRSTPRAGGRAGLRIIIVGIEITGIIVEIGVRIERNKRNNDKNNKNNKNKRTRVRIIRILGIKIRIRE